MGGARVGPRRHRARARHARDHPGWEDAAVPPERLGDYLRDFRELLDEFGYDAALYGHFGQGCVHCRIDFDLDTGRRQALAGVPRPGRRSGGRATAARSRASTATARRAPRCSPRCSATSSCGAFGEFKGIWDPDGKMNPGKVVDPYRPTRTSGSGPMRASAEPHPLRVPRRRLDFANATRRCVGVGECRDVGGRRDVPELHGDARGGGLDARAGAPAVRDARGATSSTAGATTRLRTRWTSASPARAARAIARSTSTWRRTRPSSSRTTTRADCGRAWRTRWGSSTGGRVRRRAPRLVNSLAHTPGLSSLAEARCRRRRRTRRSHGSRRRRFTAGSDTAGTRVDGAERPVHDGAVVIGHAELPRSGRGYSTGSIAARAGENRLHPHGSTAPFVTAACCSGPTRSTTTSRPTVRDAAVEVLENAGYTVEIPPRPLCCGRPLYDCGMLDAAERLWREILRTLRPWIRAGIPLVGLEPSCVAAFRDELLGLFPHDEDASGWPSRRCCSASSSSVSATSRRRFPARRRSCTATATTRRCSGWARRSRCSTGWASTPRSLDSGCCGMAGSFGFEADHYDVSLRVGERVLLPAVRAADPEP